MKKHLGIALMAAATCLVLPVVGYADVYSGSTTTARVSLQQDPDDTAVKITSAPTITFGNLTNGAKTTGQAASNIEGALTVHNPGLTSGWQVQLAATQFTMGEDSNTFLKGAEMHFTPGTIGPSTTGVAGTTVSPINQAGVIFAAEAGHGVGDCTDTFAADNVTLDVPQQWGTVGTYTSSLTWTLVNTPA